MIPRTTDPFTADEYRALEAYDHEQERRRKAEAKRPRVDRRTWRERVWDVLYAVDDGRNLTESRVWDLQEHGGPVVGVCPACRSRLPDHLTLRFHGTRDEADHHCTAGCSEEDVGRAIRSHPVWRH